MIQNAKGNPYTSLQFTRSILLNSASYTPLLGKASILRPWAGRSLSLKSTPSGARVDLGIGPLHLLKNHIVVCCGRLTFFDATLVSQTKTTHIWWPPWWCDVMGSLALAPGSRPLKTTSSRSTWATLNLWMMVAAVAVRLILMLPLGLGRLGKLGPSSLQPDHAHHHLCQ